MLMRGIERSNWKTPFKCSAFTSILLTSTFLEKKCHPSSDSFLYWYGYHESLRKSHQRKGALQMDFKTLFRPRSCKSVAVAVICAYESPLYHTGPSSVLTGTTYICTFQAYRPKRKIWFCFFFLTGKFYLLYTIFNALLDELQND